MENRSTEVQANRVSATEVLRIRVSASKVFGVDGFLFPFLDKADCDSTWLSIHVYV
jgi:hypothetical protein